MAEACSINDYSIITGYGRCLLAEVKKLYLDSAQVGEDVIDEGIALGFQNTDLHVEISILFANWISYLFYIVKYKQSASR